MAASLWTARLTALLAFLLGLSLRAAPIPVGGRVELKDGRPAAGARVALVRQAGAHEAAGLLLDGALDPPPAASAKVDAEGRFALSAPEPGAWTLTVELPGHLALERPLAPLLEEMEVPAARLTPAGDLEVRIADEAGRPLAARLIARSQGFRPAGGSGWRLRPRPATAGADGVAHLPRGAGERLRVVAVAPGRVPVRADLAAGSGRIVLPAGASRTLRVLDERGRPAAGAVALDRDELLPLARADEAGRWAAPVPARGEVLLRFRGAEEREGSLRLAPATAGPGEAKVGTEAEPTVRLLAPRAVTGRVVDAQSRRPLPGALVWFEGAAAELARTDKAGAYTVRLPANGEVYLAAAASGYLADSQIASPSVPSGPTFALDPAATVEGVVVDGKGRPVAGAEVAASPRDGDFRTLMRRFGPRLIAFPQSRTSAAGRFRLPGLPSALALDLDGSRPGSARTRLAVEPLRPFETRSGLRLVLAAGRRGVGQVVDRRGEPVRGAQVTLTAAAAEEGPRRFFARSFQEDGDGLVATTDAGGRFAVAGILPGRYQLTVEAADFAPVTVPGLAVPDGEGDVALGTVTLSPGVALAGRVRDSAGQPVAGAEIRVTPAESSGLPFARRFLGEEGPPDAVSEADGRFEVRGLSPNAKLVLTADRPGYAAETVEGLSAPPANPVEVVLRRTGRVSGRVLDADRRPVAGADVSLRPDSRGRFFGGPFQLGMAETAEDGRFEIEDVEPGTIALTAQAPGTREHRQSGLELPPGGEITGLEVVLEAGATVEGRVLAAGGLPAVGAEVRAADPGGGRANLVAFATTDGDGRFRLEGLATGPTKLSADHAEHGHADREVDVRAGVTTTELTFGGGFEVSGRVVDATGDPVAGAELSLFPTGRMLDPPRATSGADGAFTFAVVPTGSYRLSGRRAGAWTSAEERIEVRDGPVAGVVVRLNLGHGVLSGRLLGLAPADLGGIQVGATGKDGFLSGRVDYRGTYTIEGLAPGEWNVSAEAGNGRRARGKVTLPEGATEASLDLEFTGGFTLSGVATRGGQPLRSAEVEIASLGGSDRASSATDTAGAFRFENLAGGRYQLSLFDRRTGLRHNREVELDADRHLDLAIESARITGTVRDAADGKPLADAAVELRRDEADPVAPSPFSFRSSVTTDSRGFFNLGEVDAGRARLVVSRSGYARAERLLDLGAESSEGLDVQLTATEGIRFEVVGPSGLPVGRVIVAVVDGAGRVVADGIFEASEQGSVRVSTVPPGSWELLVRESGSAVLRLPVTSPGVLGRLQLPPAGTVEVSIPALAAGTMAASASVLGPDGQPYRVPGGGIGVRTTWPVTGGEAYLGGLPVGRATITVTATDGRTWTGTADVTPGGTAQLALR